MNGQFAVSANVCSFDPTGALWRGGVSAGSAAWFEGEQATVVVDRCRARSFFGSGGLINVPEAWPEALRISLRIILTTNHPMLIWWGGENKLQMLI